VNQSEEQNVSDVAINSATDISRSEPTTAETRIHWAGTSDAVSPELERKFEAMRARNWITDKMVQQYQKHWHCSRAVALERLLEKTGE
jgi:hypothetical protein